MAVLYVSEHPEAYPYQGVGAPVVDMPPIASQTVAIGATSAQVTNGFNAKARLVGVHTDAICHVAFGANPTATTSHRRLAANSTEYFRVQAGHKVAVITGS